MDIKDLAGVGQSVDAVCGMVNNGVTSYKDIKIAKIEAENRLNIEMTKLMGEVMQYSREDRMFFLQYLYPKLLQYSNFHGMSQKTKDKILLTYSQVHPDINATKLEVDDNNFKQLYTLIDLHFTERRENVQKLFEKCIKYIGNRKPISIALVKFLETIDDEQLKNIKKMMRYITKIQEGFYKIITVFGKDANECRQKKIAKMNIYFLFESGKDFFDYNREIFSDFIKNDLTISSHIIPVNSFVSGWGKLNRVGIELYRLLQDELEPYPEEYIQQLFQQ